MSTSRPESVYPLHGQARLVYALPMGQVKDGNRTVGEWLDALCRSHGRRGPSRMPGGTNEILLVDLVQGYWTVRQRGQVEAIGFPPGYRPVDGISDADWRVAVETGRAPRE